MCKAVKPKGAAVACRNPVYLCLKSELSLSLTLSLISDFLILICVPLHSCVLRLSGLSLERSPLRETLGRLYPAAPGPAMAHESHPLAGAHL